MENEKQYEGTFVEILGSITCETLASLTGLANAVFHCKSAEETKAYVLMMLSTMQDFVVEGELPEIQTYSITMPIDDENN